MVYMSRATRRDAACSLLTGVVNKLREISDSLEKIEEAEINNKVQITQKINDAQTLIKELSPGDFEDLKDEMESWASNMEGTNLEYTSKYETVSETANVLGDVVSNIESINAPDIDISSLTAENIKEFANDIKEIAADIENSVGDAENIEFPGMYG
jgi:hypothetical protein